MHYFYKEDISSLEGKTAIVTGANVGLGYETTLALAKKGAHLILASRSEEKAKLAIQKILEQVPKAKLEFIQIDLGSLHSIATFADICNKRFSQLDILVNNAGVMVPPYTLTKDGFEQQFGVNYLGHFYLTSLLFPLIKKTKNARIVMLSSLAHVHGEINFKDLQSTTKYHKMTAYRQSKLACLLFAYELDRRLKASNIEVKSIAAHPGVSITNLVKNFSAYLKFLMILLKPILPFFSHPPHLAAEPIIVAAAHSNIKSGDFMGPVGFKDMKGKTSYANSTSQSKNEELAKELWQVSEKLLGINFTIN